MGIINFLISGGMYPADKARLRDSLVVGEFIPVKKATARRGISTKKYKVLAKYEHYFIVDNGNYRDSFLYIDLFSTNQEEE